MAQTEQTTFLNFDQGMDSYTNAHRLNPSVLSLAVGVALDRPGYAYPGPGNINVTNALDSLAPILSLFGYQVLAQGSSDYLTAWGVNPFTSNPGFPAFATSSNGNPVSFSNQSVYPFRQNQSRLTSGDPLRGSDTISMTSPPQSATTAANQITAWLEPSGLYCVVKNLTSGVSSGIVQISTTSSVSGQWAIVGATGHFYVMYLVGGNIQVDIFNDFFPVSVAIFPASAHTVTPNNGTPSVICATGQAAPGPGDSDAVGFCYLSGTQLWAFTATGTTLSAQTQIASAGTIVAPITMSVALGPGVNNDLLAPVGFLFAWFQGAAFGWGVRYTNLSLVNQQSGNFGGGSSNLPATPTQVTISFSDAGLNSFSLIAEGLTGDIRPTGTANAVHWAVLYFYNTAFSNLSGYTTRYRMAWGGLALIGRARLVQWAVSPDVTAPGTTKTVSTYGVFVPTRSGWRAYDGTWGTTTTAGAAPAYPSGFLYDRLGNLVAKFGDSDVGSDSLWPEFASGSYTPTNLPILSEASVVTGTVSSQGTFLWPFPQYFDLLTFAADQSGTTTIRADIGAPIGALPGPSLVQWTDANFLSPPAPAVQQGSTVTIPGALTAQFDGSQVFEAGWLMACPTPIVKLTAGGSLPIGTSTYEFVAVAVFKDANGKLYRSAPSFPVQAPATTSGNQSYTLYIPDLWQTLHYFDQFHLAAGGSPLNPQIVQFELYRNVPSQANNTTFYRLPQVLTGHEILTFTVPTPVSTDFFLASQPDSTLDQDLLTLLPLYTTGMATGAASGTNNPLPFDCLTNWNNATWGLARRNGAFELWFTWPQDDNIIRSEGPAWNTNNRIPLPNTVGQPRALVPMDNQLIVLGSRSDCIITGPGPIRSVSYADDPSVYTVPTALPGSGGIKTLNGITVLPQGVLFQSEQGFTMLDRSLSYNPIGQQVRLFTDKYAYLPGVINAAQQAVLLYAKTPQQLGVPTDLIYFYNQNLWGTIEHPLSGSAIAGPVEAATKVGNADGSSTVYAGTTDGVGTQVSRYSQFIEWRTAWLEFTGYNAGGQNLGVRQEAAYGTMREVQVLMDSPGQTPHLTATLTLLTEYDYESNTTTPPETQSLTVTTKPGDTQFRFGLNASQCRRVRFTVTLEVAPGTSNPTPLFLITGLDVHYASDAGLSRLGSPNSANF